MAYDYDKMKTAYESLSKEQQRQVAEQNKDNANFQQFAVDYTKERYGTGSSTPAQSTPSTPVETKTETPETPVVKEETKTEVVETPEVKQEGALKPLSQDYYNQTGTESQEQIVRNLNDYKQTNPEYFKDYESFKKNFSYNARNEEQKNTLDQWYNGYQKGLELSTIPTTDLYTQYNAGQVSTSDLEILRTTNPTKYAELMNQINKGNILSAYDDTSSTGGDTDLKDMAYQMMMQTFQRFMSGESDSKYLQFFEEYKSNMNSPEMMDLLDKTTELEEEATNINDDIAAMKKAVEKEYEGTGASRAKINAIIADRTYELQLQLRTVDAEYKKYATQYNNRMQQYQKDFQLQLQQYQLGMQERNQQMQELGFALDLMSFETPEQKSAREWDYWVKQQEYTNGDINSKDYNTRYKAALNSVNNLLSQYNGIPLDKSAEEMAEDLLNNMAKNGTTLGEELSLINTKIQGTPEYKKLWNDAYGSSGFKKPETFTIDGVDYVVWNGQLMRADEFNDAYNAQGQAKWYQAVDESALSMSIAPHSMGVDENGNPTLESNKTLGQFLVKKANGTKGGQCGKFVNDYLEYIGLGRYYDDDLSTKLNSINSYAPKVGTVAVFDYGHQSSDGINHGHVGIVTGIDMANRTVTIKDSNYGSNEKIQTRTISMDDPSLKGFFDPTQQWGSNNKAKSSNTTTDGLLKKDYVKGREGMYDDYINATGKPTDATLKEWGKGNIAKGLELFEAEVRDYQEKTGVGTLETKKTKEVNELRKEMHGNQAYTDYNQMQSYWQKIKNNTNNETATAASDVALLFNFMKMLDPKSIVRESEFKTAQNMGSLPEKWKAAALDAINGKKLTDAQRTQIYEESAGLMDGATYLYNNLLDDYASMIVYGGDASRLGKRGEYVTAEYQNKYGGGATGTETITYGDGWDANLPRTTGYTGATVTLGGTVFDSNWNEIGTVSYETNTSRRQKTSDLISRIPKVYNRNK